MSTDSAVVATGKEVAEANLTTQAGHANDTGYSSQ